MDFSRLTVSDDTDNGKFLQKIFYEKSLVVLRAAKGDVRLLDGNNFTYTFTH